MGNGVSLGASIDFSKLRWGDDVEPEWIYGIEHTDVSALEVIASVNIISGKKAMLYGFKISAEENNEFYIRMYDDVSGSTYTDILIVFPSSGTLEYYDKVKFSDLYINSTDHYVELIVVNACSNISARYEGAFFVAYKDL